MVKFIISFIVVFSATITFAEENNLEYYVNLALKENLALKQKDFSYQKSISALNEARSLFLPTVDIKARYTRAGGGRMIDFPIGDLMNPVHLTLNQLTGAGLFPGNLENESIPLLREEEHETKISVVQPVFNLKLLHNYNMQSGISNLQLEEKKRYARELIAEVKKAWFNISKADAALNIYQNALKLANENLRVSNSLVKNNSRTAEIIYSAEAEVADLETSIANAEKDLTIAKQYFNFLLNRNADEQINIAISRDEITEITDNPDYANTAGKNREELKKLKLAMDVTRNQVSLARANYFPNLNLAFEYGFQGKMYRFKSDDDYWMASLVLSWNIFNGFGDNAKIEQAKYDSRAYSAKYQETQKLISIEVKRIAAQMNVAAKAVKTTRKQIEATTESYKIIARKYKEGITNQINLLKARNDKTMAELQNSIARFEYNTAVAELEKAACLINIDEKLKSL